MLGSSTVYKKAMLLIIVGMVAGVFWFWVEPWVVSPVKFANAGVWIKPLVMLCILTACVGLALLLVKNKLLRLAVSGLVALPFFFIFGYNHYYILALFIMLLAHLRAVKQIHIQEEGRVRVDIKEIMNHGLPAVITPILIMISFAFFLSPGVQGAAKQGQLPPTTYQVVSQVVGTFLGSEFEALPVSERKRVEAQLIDDVIKKFNQVLGPYFVFLPPVLAFGLFLILQGLSFIFVWLGTLVAMMLFWVLKRAGFIRLKMVQKEAEELEF